MNFAEALGRVFLSTLFLYESVKKYFYQYETIEYMESYGVPEFLFYPSLFFELIVPILLIIGFKTRIAATLMFLFTLIVSIIFHSDFSNNMQIIAFFKKFIYFWRFFNNCIIRGKKVYNRLLFEI